MARTGTRTRGRTTERHFTLRTLRQSCEEMRGMLGAYTPPLATPPEIAAYWPGGAQNAYRGHDAWIYCHAQLIRFVGRLEFRERDAVDDRLAGIVAEAQRAQPLTVALSDGSSRQIYPKGIRALAWLDILDRIVSGVLHAFGDAVAKGLSVDETAAIALKMAELVAIRVWAWCLCHPGADAPWTDDASSLTPPDWTAALTPQDLLVIDQAHRAIHGERMAIMAHAFPPSPGGGSRLGIGGLLASYQYEKGLTQQAMRLLSVGEIVAGAVASADAHRLATEAAERERARR